MTRYRRTHRLIPRIPGQIYLWLAMLIFGTSSAVTRKLTQIGAQNFMGDRNPISLCNVLFVGNLCALIIFIAIYWRQWNLRALKQLSRKDWYCLVAIAILSGALAPGLIFQALALTQVNNVILVGRLEPPLTLALSLWLLKERVNLWEVMGAIAAFVGVILTIILQPPGQTMMNMGGFSVGIGEILAAAAAVASGASTIIGKRSLAKIPLGIYSIFRTALGTLIFFFIALELYGSNHFMDVFSPFLWQWMFVYAAVIVVLGQFFWSMGLRASTVSMASLIGSFSPIVGILAAYFILGEAPTFAQYVGGSVILTGVLLSQIGKRQETSRTTVFSGMDSTQGEQEVETGMGFKGM
ncbi:EamA family transporter [Brasilonema octagenarum UFV-E1]|uniref:EamA family transporter n=1 Tax=Brasilonema sennae CENA114 TaxID=415709 RepID=A0A856MAX8_9CYAN|nr:DMT family transporter [Brasilonema sennae]QDL07490.1 EamA family transporter [Brasilonema sennae CENA114]QDL13852.1 EamA family transporter [Brasilonema octagenarum UFV-E1]